MDKEDRNYFILFMLCIMTAAFSLRAPITCVGPVVQQIKAELNISSGIAGMLTTIPIIIFALTAFFAGAVLPRYRIGPSSAVCFLLTAAGAVIRSFGGSAGLYFGTILIGLGIGTLNVMIPAMNREKMPGRIGVLTGVYNVSLNLMAGLGSGLAYPLSRTFGSWRPAIAVWGLFPLLAIPLWQKLCRSEKFHDSTGTAYSPFHAAKKFLSGKVWPLAFLMALQSFIYYALVIAWAPTMLNRKGISAQMAGSMTIFTQIVSLAPAFLVPVRSVDPRNRTRISLLGGFSYILSVVIYMVFDSLPMMFVCCFLWGIGSGSCFSYVLSMISLSGKSKAETTWISGFVQMFGYAFAAIGPVLFGFIVDAAGSWTVPMIVVIILSLCYIAAGIRSGKTVEK